MCSVSPDRAEIAHNTSDPCADFTSRGLLHPGRCFGAIGRYRRSINSGTLLLPPTSPTASGNEWCLSSGGTPAHGKCYADEASECLGARGRIGLAPPEIIQPN